MAVVYYQRKYCEDCGVYYEYSDVGAPDDTEPCPVNPAHTTRDHKTIRNECDVCSAQIKTQ